MIHMSIGVCTAWHGGDNDFNCGVGVHMVFILLMAVLVKCYKNIF